MDRNPGGYIYWGPFVQTWRFGVEVRWDGADSARYRGVALIRSRDSTVCGSSDGSEVPTQLDSLRCPCLFIWRCNRSHCHCWWTLCWSLAVCKFDFCNLIPRRVCDVLFQTAKSVKSIASFYLGRRITALAWSPRTLSPGASDDWLIEWVNLFLSVHYMPDQIMKLL